MPDAFRKATPPPSGRVTRSPGKVDPPDAPERLESTEPDDDLEQYRAPVVDDVAAALVVQGNVAVDDGTQPAVRADTSGVSYPDAVPAGPTVTSADHELVLRLQQELAVAMARIDGRSSDVSTWAAGDPPIDPQPGDKVLIHVRRDGFTANGQVWFLGQELEFTVGEQNWRDTCDRSGKSWVTLSDADQLRRWGEIMFGHGPWPGGSYEDPRAAEREARRGRTAPTIVQLTAETPSQR